MMQAPGLCVLGIDPGSRMTGFGLVRLAAGGRVEYVASGCVRAQGDDLGARLGTIHEGVREIVERYRPDACAVERVFFARNADSALKLGQARGAAIAAVAVRGLTVVEYTALEIKRSVVGHGHAAKDQVSHMVRALLSLPKAPQADAADALGAALCHAHHLLGMAGRAPAGRRVVRRLRDLAA